MTKRWLAARDVYHLGVIALLVTVGSLPFARVRTWVARGLGSLAYRRSTSKRRAAEAGLHSAFGDETGTGAIVRSSFVEFWREMLEWTSPPTTDQTQVSGLDYLRETLARGHGAILWESNGFGYRTRSKQFLHAAGLPVHQVHGRNNVGNFHVPDGSATWLRERLVQPFFDRREERWVAGIVNLPASESLAFTRRLHRILARNGILCVAGDGQDGRRFVPVDFLGRTVRLASGMVSLAHLSGAGLHPLLCSRDEIGRPVVTIGPPIRTDPEAARDDALRDALQQYATQLEAYIRRQPGLYRNWHLLDGLARRATEHAA